MRISRQNGAEAPSGTARQHGLRLIALAIVVTTVLPGCALFHRWFPRHDPYGMSAPCMLPENLPLPELLAHLNNNITKAYAWRATNARIKTRGPAGLPVAVSAMLAVEAPRSFRLLASSLTGSEVDLGSNAEQFWFWNRRSEEKYVFTARHERLEIARKRFPIPFQPDWIIEAMGVTPIDESEVTLEPAAPGSRKARLIAQRVSPQGEPVTKVIVVDTCHGLVLEHALFDGGGRLIARAVLLGHAQDPVSGVVLPTRIDLEWPQAQLGLTIELGPVEVNPPQLPPQVFAIPVMADYPILDLGK